MPRPAERADRPLEALLSLAVTEILTDFLRQELRRYRNATLEDRKVVSVAVLAGRIQASDEGLDFSPETLRRFLNGEKQNTSAEIIRAIAAFLVEEEWLTPTDLETAGQKIDYRAAHALSAFFRIKDSEKNRDFYRTLAGTYRQYLFVTDRIVQIDCRIGVDQQAGILNMVETVRNFDILPATALAKDFLSDPKIAILDPRGLERRLPSQAKLVGAPLSASGFGLSDHRLIAFFLSDLRTGLPRLYDIYSVVFDKDDDVIGLSGTCNAGWKSAVTYQQAPDLEEAEGPRIMDTARFLMRQQQMGAQLA